MWLECIGVVSGCCCIRRYIDNSHNNYYFALIHLYLLSFWQQHPYFLVNVFSFLFMLFLCNFIIIIFLKIIGIYKSLLLLNKNIFT